MSISKIKAGFAKIDITPPLGVAMQGYFSKREASGILDPLYASSLALETTSGKFVIISCDLIGIGAEYIEDAKKIITSRLGLPRENVMIHSTHTHTGPKAKKEVKGPKTDKLGETDDEYMAVLVRKLSDVAQMALDGVKEAEISVGYGCEKSISFIRRFRMKDGSTKTNPGVGNPDIVEPVGAIVPMVGVVRISFTDNSGEIIVVNFALHPDIVGGTRFSADYPGHMRRAVSKLIPDCEVVYINGTAGDINHVDAMHPGNTSSGYEYSRKVGNILAAEVIKTLQKMKATEAQNTDYSNIRSNIYSVEIPQRRVTEEQKINALGLVQKFHSGEWVTKSMSDIGDIAGAYQTLDLAESEGKITMGIQVLAFGDIAFVGLPGEIFADIGRNICSKSPFTHTFISSLTNGSYGYFPTKKAFDEGGYESKNNPFTGELEGLIVDTAVKLLKDLF